MTQKPVFIIGGTGNIGTKAVKDLLANNVPLTLFARDPEKAKTLFPDHVDHIRIVRGNYDDLDAIKEGIQGHERLLLLVLDNQRPGEIKGNIAKIAYEAGVKQIVDISTIHMSRKYRAGFIPNGQYVADQAIHNIPNRGYLVSLRPHEFMSNLFWTTRKDMKVFADDRDENEVAPLISPNDIGAMAAVILQEDIQKHGDMSYDMTGDLVTGKQRAAIFSKLFGHDVSYMQVTPVEKYHKLMSTGYFPHAVAIDIVDTFKSGVEEKITPCIEIVLGRKPESLEEYLTSNQHRFY
ncbi:hypothetical protein A0J61_08384 [Choanephora cucurbitarum]|uniref:NmrA-like domain-containing protein n=1 Tax=Choanephora cucurbitarum TaxID=101091 RepID=A0A1C7N4G6_9FUNG|nr:hypothetical protein A0J61_08384 [Choanephora cucurbitarum]